MTCNECEEANLKIKLIPCVSNTYGQAKYYVYTLKRLGNTEGNDTFFDINGAFSGHKLPPFMDEYFLVQEKAQQCTRHLR